jgi:hypothetical protein
VTRETLGYVLGRRAWCLRCATPTASADARPVLGVPGRAQALTCVACGDDVGDPGFGKGFSVPVVRPAADIGAIQEPPREEESDVSKSKKTKGPKPKAMKAAKAPKPPKAAPAERRREFKRDPRLPAAGSKITKTYRDKEIVVTVTDDGLSYGGKTYASLTAVAREVTGARAINGYPFFGLVEGGAKAVAKKKPATAKA